jgi:hypothetical protein
MSFDTRISHMNTLYASSSIMGSMHDIIRSSTTSPTTFVHFFAFWRHSLHSPSEIPDTQHSRVSCSISRRFYHLRLAACFWHSYFLWKGRLFGTYPNSLCGMHYCCTYLLHQGLGMVSLLFTALLLPFFLFDTSFGFLLCLAIKKLLFALVVVVPWLFILSRGGRWARLYAAYLLP